MADRPLNFLCITSYHKGQDFIRGCKEAGNTVFVLMDRNLAEKEWPWEYIDEVLYFDEWVEEHIQNTLAYKFRFTHFDRFVALDDFDVETVASLREHFRMPGMGETTARHFRDKLAMRLKAKESGIPVPQFSALFNDEAINKFADTVPAPWVIKPRSEASAAGIKKVHSKEEMWEKIHALGDQRHHFLIERFAPGQVFHVDGLTHAGKVKFSRVSGYLDTPMEVAHGGGIFRSHTLEIGSEDEKALQKLNADVMKSFGMRHGASHTEFIKSNETGEYFFLETSSRVGGANLAEMVEAASGINLWKEWAKIETAVLKDEPYKLPKPTKHYAGIVASLSRYEWPDFSSFSDSEIIWRMNKAWHIGMILKSDDQGRILELLNYYTDRIKNEFHASLPSPDTLR